MPLVHMGVFIEKATPFLEEFLERLTLMNYPTARIRLFIHNNVGSEADAASVRLLCLTHSRLPTGGLPRAPPPPLLGAAPRALPGRPAGRT